MTIDTFAPVGRLVIQQCYCQQVKSPFSLKASALKNQCLILFFNFFAFLQFVVKILSTFFCLYFCFSSKLVHLINQLMFVLLIVYQKLKNIFNHWLKLKI